MSGCGGSGSFQKDTFCYTGIYRGIVTDVDDPNQFGRVRIRVLGIHGEGILNSQVPWAVPAFSLFSGSGSNHGSFSVPEVGSYVFVFFEGEDVNQPVYFAEAPDGVHGLPTERTTNYPSRKISKTKNGITIYIDDQAQIVRLNHPSGKYIQMDGSGNITISAGDITVTGGNITISGTRIDLNP